MTDEIPPSQREGARATTPHPEEPAEGGDVAHPEDEAEPKPTPSPEQARKNVEDDPPA